MNERGIVLISVLILLTTLSLLWTGLAVRIHQLTLLTTTLTNQAHTQLIYTTNIEPTIRTILKNQLYPPSHLPNPTIANFTISTEIIDAQAKPNINHSLDEEQIFLLKGALHNCGLDSKEQWLITTLSHQLSVGYLNNPANLIQRKNKKACFNYYFYALPASNTAININTAPDSTLALLAPNVDTTQRQSFIKEREAHLFTSLEALNYHLGNLLKNYHNLTLVSDYFYTITTFKNPRNTISYKTLWYRTINVYYTHLEKQWTIEI